MRYGSGMGTCFLWRAVHRWIAGSQAGAAWYTAAAGYIIASCDAMPPPAPGPASVPGRGSTGPAPAPCISRSDMPGWASACEVPPRARPQQPTPLAAMGTLRYKSCQWCHTTTCNTELRSATGPLSSQPRGTTLPHGCAALLTPWAHPPSAHRGAAGPPSPCWLLAAPPSRRQASGGVRRWRRCL